VADAALNRLSAYRRQSGEMVLYWAWVASAFLLLLVIGPYDPRYMFFVYPALSVIVYAAMFRLSANLLPAKIALAVPAVVAAVCLLTGLGVPPNYMTGPAESAAAVFNGAPQRVVYCGSTDGNFIFAMRALDPELKTVVIPGEKIPAQDMSPAGFETFAHKYGVNFVVLERTGRPQACDDLEAAPTRSMALHRKIPLLSSNPRWTGHLSIYRFTNPSPQPEETLKLSIPKIGRDVDVRF
jgi:hypothetical protein